MSKEIKENTPKVATEVAIESLIDFLDKHDRKGRRAKKHTPAYVEDNFDACIMAIEDGNLTFNSNQVPTLKLYEPLYANGEDKSLEVHSVTVRARIKQHEKTKLMDGLNIEKKQGTYILRVMAYITQLGLPDIEQLGKDDYEILNQICSVF